MPQKYEYKFVRLTWGWFSRRKTNYREKVDEYAREGWRLVQVFSPGIGIYGTSRFFELILEREVGRS